MTSQPCNGKSFVQTQKKVWTSQWSVILRTFYRQILSLLYSSFFFWNFRHRLARELLVSKKHGPKTLSPKKHCKDSMQHIEKTITRHPAPFQGWPGWSGKFQVDVFLRFLLLRNLRPYDLLMCQISYQCLAIVQPNVKFRKLVSRFFFVQMNLLHKSIKRFHRTSVLVDLGSTTLDTQAVEKAYIMVWETVDPV